MEVETEIVLEVETPDTAQVRKALPFTFAKRHGVLIQELGDTEGKAVYRSGASPLSLAEARRFAGVPLKLSRVSAEVFDTLLQESYEQDSTKASQMVDGLDEEFDLTQVASQLACGVTFPLLCNPGHGSQTPGAFHCLSVLISGSCGLPATACISP